MSDRVETVSYDFETESFVIWLERPGTYGPPRMIRVKPSQLEKAFDTAFQQRIEESAKSATAEV